jgi:hypothetical protein
VSVIHNPYKIVGICKLFLWHDVLDVECELVNDIKDKAPYHRLT